MIILYYFVLHYIVQVLALHYIYGFSNNCTQPDEGQVKNGRNM